MAARFAVGTQEAAAEGGDVLFELGAGEAFAGDDDLAACKHAFEQFGGDDPSGALAGASSKPTGSPSGEQSR